ncbi:MAG: hypothetical protein N2044_07865 [Cyclobacteriaceae bacterium]|nr:hypothetical protein [Cyclobacteriaceae bacterium]MCX7637743.1 hypothetical protein [Cyclobacteriaceae bacterium]MDW8331779.1 hypothetical protein [Cyclobacteriaceae bacterium]
MHHTLTPAQLESVKKSYLNIVALFLSQDRVSSKYFRCLLKWGFQLHIGPDDLRKHADLSHLSFTHPGEMSGKAEEIFNLVNMIYLDKVVEDTELEIATLYAEKLGFSSRLVSELFTAIATADEEGETLENVRNRVEEFVRMAG